MENFFPIFAGRASKELTSKIIKHLKASIGRTEIRDFADGEISVQIQENVRGKSIFLVQSICPPNVNRNLLELLIMVDAMKRASAAEITAVIPYFGYARQDRKDRPRVSITSKLVANLLEAAGVNRVVCVDLHSDQIQGFFNIPVDNLYSSYCLIPTLEKIKNNLVVVSPDVGGTTRARAYASRLKVPLGIIDKRRDPFVPNKAKAMNVIGDVKGKKVVIVDDMIDTAGTLVEAVQALIKAGATSVYCAAAHPVFSNDAVERIETSDLEKVFVTDTIPFNSKSKKVKIISVAPLLAEAIKRIQKKQSISSLFV